MRKVIPIVHACALPAKGSHQHDTKHLEQSGGSVSLSGLYKPSLLQTLPPLSLYIHVPWCIRKCPYCDFNSHELRTTIPEDRYLEALAADLEQALPLVWGRLVHSVFIGGGTPSLLSAGAIDRMLALVRSYLPLVPDAEITLEANPGASEASRFKSYAASGINRLSLGIQSFNDRHLHALGRVHQAEQARKAIGMAQEYFDRVNLDLMFGLPQQTLHEALKDTTEAISYGTEHLSLYQLTLEANTVFAKFPPELPDADLCSAIEHEIESLVGIAGFERYEVSAFAKNGKQSRHNVNYWEFGDYLGIGPGAHGKISFPDRIERHAKLRNPDAWMSKSCLRDASHIAEHRLVNAGEMSFEFMLNVLRLKAGVPVTLYTERTGQTLSSISSAMHKAMDKGLMSTDPVRIRATDRGWRFLNDLQEIFL